LLHPQVDVGLRDKTLRPLIDNGTYRPSSSSDKLHPVDAISDVWPEQPPKDRLHVFAGLLAPVSSPTLLPLPDKNAASYELWPMVTIKTAVRGKFGKMDALMLNDIIRWPATEELPYLQEFRNKLKRPLSFKPKIVCLFFSFLFNHIPLQSLKIVTAFFLILFRE
jgi:hypothetical protein